MSDALVGLVGVLVGLAIGSGFSFWSTRRTELAEALLAVSVLAEELLALRAEPQRPAAGAARLLHAWNQHRAPLSRVLAPADYELVGAAVRWRDDVARLPSPNLDRALAALRDRLWEEHQAFIVTPLIRFVRRDLLSHRLHAAVDPLRSPRPYGRSG